MNFYLPVSRAFEFGLLFFWAVTKSLICLSVNNEKWTAKFKHSLGGMTFSPHQQKMTIITANPFSFFLERGRIDLVFEKPFSQTILACWLCKSQQLKLIFFFHWFTSIASRKTRPKLLSLNCLIQTTAFVLLPTSSSTAAQELQSQWHHHSTSNTFNYCTLQLVEEHWLAATGLSSLLFAEDQKSLKTKISSVALWLSWQQTLQTPALLRNKVNSHKQTGTECSRAVMFLCIWLFSGDN